MYAPTDRPDVLAARPGGRFAFDHVLDRADAGAERLQGRLLSTLRRIGDLLQRVALVFRCGGRHRDTCLETGFLGIEGVL